MRIRGAFRRVNNELVSLTGTRIQHTSGGFQPRLNNHRISHIDCGVRFSFYLEVIMTQTTVLIAGSRDATPDMLEYARRAVRRAKERGYTVMVGDNPKGVDMAVVRECRRLHVPVIVAGANNFPRNGGCSHGSYVKVHRDVYRASGGHLLPRYTIRDRWMVDNANIGIFIWNGDSPGTKKGYEYMHSRKKDAHLIQFEVRS